MSEKVKQTEAGPVELSLEDLETVQGGDRRELDYLLRKFKRRARLKDGSFVSNDGGPSDTTSEDQDTAELTSWPS